MRTWTEDYSDMFNYSSSNQKMSSFVINTNGYILRQKNNIAFIASNSYHKHISSFQHAKICQIDKDDNNYYLKLDYDTDNITYNIDNKAYIIADSISNNSLGYEITQGDIIKIGRYKFKIRKISLKNNNINNINDIKIGINDNNYNKVDKKEEEKQCKICFQNDETISPLISPCSCTGSVKYIHLLCLQKWLKSKLKIDYMKSLNQNNLIITAFRLEPIQCELCKEYMPDFIKKNNNIYEICDYNSVDENNRKYIILETIGSEKHHEKFIFNINFNSNLCEDKNEMLQLIIGRSNDCDIRLIDNSISRNHSILTIKDNKLYIKDMDSKFGTGILLQNTNLKFIDEAAISIQLGRSILSFYQKNKSGIFCKCFNGNKDKNNFDNDKGEYYFNENKKGINFYNGYNIKYN